MKKQVMWQVTKSAIYNSDFTLKCHKNAQVLVVSRSKGCAHGLMEESFSCSLIFLLFTSVRTKLVQQKIYGMSFVGVT